MARRIYSRVTIALAIGAILATTPTIAQPVHAKNDPLRRNGAEELRLRVEREAVVDTTPSDTLADEVREIASLLRQDLGNAARFRPDDAFIDAIAATAKDGELLRAYAAHVYAQLPSLGAAARPGQSEILVNGPELSGLPGGYTQQRSHFRDGIAIYGFKYVEPGKSSGMAYDGLIRIGNQWAFIPKAWRAFVP